MILKRLLPALLIVPILSACLTKSPEVKQKTITTRVADLTIELSYISRDELIKRHGKNTYYNQNPFIDYPGRVPPRNIIVFDTVLRTEVSTVLVEIKDIKLAVEDKSGPATNILYLRNLWKAYAQVDQKGWPALQRAARNYMLPDEVTIEPESPASGYLVFPNAYPKEGGEGLLTMEVATPNGDRGTVEIPMYFTEHGAEDDMGQDDNTGIFANEGS